jgi:molybdopterin-guanine dinucleotide biosynthesis protein A
VEPLSGAVLAGSSLAPTTVSETASWASGRVSEVREAAEVLAEVCEDVLLVGGDPSRYMRLDLPARWTPDAIPGEGVLASILGALFVAEHQECLIIQPVAPLPRLDLLQAMAAEPRDYDVLAYPKGEGCEPLLAIYSQSCIPVLERLLYAGNLEAPTLLGALRVRMVPDRIVDAYGDEDYASSRLNTLSDLAERRP